MNRTILSVTLFCLMITGIILDGNRPAQASQCIVPTEAGAWRNYDTETNGITRTGFRMECRDASTTTCDGDICSTTSAVRSHYFISLFGKCHPSDCVWGEVEGSLLTGNLDGWYYFEYNQGFAKRYVYVRTYPQWPGWLRVWVYTDFADPGRSDYTSDDWFIHG